MRDALMKSALTSGATTMVVIRSRRRHSQTLASAEVRERSHNASSLSAPYLLAGLSTFYLSTQTDQECFGIPSFPPWPYPLSRPRPDHSLVQCIPLCSNYEKECSFGTRRGIHNGQRPLETIIDPRIPSFLSKARTTFTRPPSRPRGPRIFNPSPAAHRLPISRKALSTNGCVLHVGVDDLHFLSR